MSELAWLQEDFSAALTGVAPPGFVLRGDPEVGARRFSVYRNNVRLMRMNALTAAYPLIRNIVGAEFFTGLARQFAIGHDSQSGDLNEYGALFDEFLQAFEPARELPYLPDVVRLEWRLHRAYYAADAAAFDPARLAAVPQERWGELRFRLHPAHALLRSPWPLARIREVNLPEYAGEMAVDFAGAENFVLVTRPDYDPTVASLAAGEFAWLDALARGLTLAQALQCAGAIQPDFDLAQALQDALRRRVLVDCFL
jgi:hypothetical protein